MAKPFEPNERSTHIMKTRQALSWIDEDGILCAYYFKDAPKKLTEQEEQEGLDRVKDLIEEFGKLPILIHMDNSPPSDKKGREEGAPLLESMTKAMALVGTNPVNRIAAKMFFGLKPSSYPVKIFKDVEEARQWLVDQIS